MLHFLLQGGHRERVLLFRDYKDKINTPFVTFHASLHVSWPGDAQRCLYLHILNPAT